jgi:predicted nuclease with TOPRIM domain
MNENDLLAGIPAWAKYVGGSTGFVAAGVLWLRQWLSSAKVDRTIDTEAVQTIQRLQAQVESERKRADDLMHEREAMATEIGSLRGEVAALRNQVEMLVKLIQQKQPALLTNVITGQLPQLPPAPEGASV